MPVLFGARIKMIVLMTPLSQFWPHPRKRNHALLYNISHVLSDLDQQRFPVTLEQNRHAAGFQQTFIDLCSLLNHPTDYR